MNREFGSTVPRVLHVVGAMNVGGAETMLMDLHRRIDRSRLQFDYLVYDEGAFDTEIRNLGGRVLRLPHPRTRGRRRAIADIRRLIRREGPFSAVHAHLLHASALAMRAAAGSGVGIRIAHSHSTGDLQGGMARWAYRRWSRHVIGTCSTQLVACGADAGRYLFGARPYSRLRNGVDLGLFRPASADTRREVRRSLGVDSNLAIGAIARLEPVKNHSFLFGIAAQLRDARVPFTMVLAGDGSQRAQIDEDIRRWDLAGHVELLGFRNDVPTLMAGLDVLVMPSRYEGIPVVLIEAQAAGLPCLVSDSVSAEVDLGIGLVDFLPLKSTRPWVEHLSNAVVRADEPDVGVTEAVRAAGGDIAQSVLMLNQLYGLEA